MDIETPRSLTAIVHVKFNYQEPKAQPVTEGEIELLSRILDQASECSPEQQELLVKFADYLRKLGVKVG